MFKSKLFTPAGTQICDRNTGIRISVRVLTAHSKEGKWTHITHNYNSLLKHIRTYQPSNTKHWVKIQHHTSQTLTRVSHRVLCIDKSVDVLGHIISDVSWDHQVFCVSQHQTTFLRSPSWGCSDPDLCPSSVGPLFGPFYPNPSRGSLCSLCGGVDGSYLCSSCDAEKGVILCREQAAKQQSLHIPPP